MLPSDRLCVPRPPTRKCIGFGSGESEKLERTQRIWRLNFNSECRDNVAWPTTAAWRMNLSNPMRNVSSVNLSSVALHASEYTVDVWNNTLDISVGGNTHTVTVPVGIHTTGTSLAEAVQATIRATHPALANFIVSYTPSTDTMIVRESTPDSFSLLWRSGPGVNTGMWKTMGYDLVDVSSSLGETGDHEIIAPHRIDLVGPLAIDVFADELCNSVDGPIGRVALERPSAGGAVFQTYNTNTNTNTMSEAHTFWPISRITFLTFRFMVQRVKVDDVGGDGTKTHTPAPAIANATVAPSCDYRPYVFNGRNVTLRVEFGCTEYVNPMVHDVQLDPTGA